MTSWLLIILIASPIGGVGHVKMAVVSETQCRAILAELLPLRGPVGAGCFGPNGEKVSLADLKEL